METKTVEQLAQEKYPYITIQTGLSDSTVRSYNKFMQDFRDAFIAGYTTAQSEQSEMVKKSAVVKLVRGLITNEKDALRSNKVLHPSITMQLQYAKSVLTELLTKLKDL